MQKECYFPCFLGGLFQLRIDCHCWQIENMQGLRPKTDFFSTIYHVYVVGIVFV